ncbi:hypothetical protein AGMMS49579_21360 [Spirochaetia bacterium]|nr:hypothetical protein AGMMS49579_21360 [Spirochaetia bacterium]
MKKNFVLRATAIVMAAALVFAGCSKKGSGDGADSGSGSVKSVNSASKENPATDFRYDLNATGDGVIIEAHIGKTGGKVIIPANIEGFPVVEIGIGAFEEPKEGDYSNRVTEVLIPESVTKLGGKNSVVNYTGEVFKNCIKLKSVNIPSGVTIIEPGTFENCTSLTSITIPESVIEIGYSAFEGCTELTDVKLPTHSIEYSTYYGLDQTFFRCSKLSLAVRKAITDTGYKGIF